MDTRTHSSDNRSNAAVRQNRGAPAVSTQVNPTDETTQVALGAAVERALDYLGEGGIPPALSDTMPVSDQAALLLDELTRLAAVRALRLLEQPSPTLGLHERRE